jgi:hypothetical protein
MNLSIERDIAHPDVRLEKSKSSLVGKTWLFMRGNGERIAGELTLLADGSIVGYFNANEASWRISDGCLEFLDTKGRPTTRFSETATDAEGRLELNGAFLPGPPGARHVLRELPTGGTLVSVRASSRRNLVVMRAGDKALYPNWPTAALRNWDLAISFYGDGSVDWGQEYFLSQTGPKWQPVHTWFTANPHLLRQYDYFWFPDDDIMTSWENVNDLFDICRRYELQLAQPALTGDSYRFHEVTIEQPDYLLRFTVFVEGMVPMFRADTLRLCLPVMQEVSRFGWGHDWVFPKLLGYPPNRIAIVDACAVTHTRPAGVNTDSKLANRQLRELVTKYGAKFMDHRVRGVIFRCPLPGVVET